MFRAVREAEKTEAPCYNRCGTIKISPCSKAVSFVHSFIEGNYDVYLNGISEIFSSVKPNLIITLQNLTSEIFSSHYSWGFF